MKISDLDTPALLVDLDRVEANLHRWEMWCRQRGIRNRPHIKTHKIPELAQLQLKYGAVGVTCQKLGEAEAMADGGITDIFLPYNIVGETKLNRLLALHQRVQLRVSADNPTVITGLAGTAARAGKPLEVMVECDTGMHRAGVPKPADAVELARLIRQQPALRFTGFCTYPWSPEAARFMREAKRLCAQDGIPVTEISGGGTPGMWREEGLEELTEYRAGTFIFNDRIIVASGAATFDDCAATLLLSVVSDAGTDYVTVDGGTKTFSSDLYGQTDYGVVLDDHGTTIVRCSEEHGVLQHCGSKPRYKVGEKVRVIPNHACIILNLHDAAYGVRGDEVVARWNIAARGKVQ